MNLVWLHNLDKDRIRDASVLLGQNGVMIALGIANQFVVARGLSKEHYGTLILVTSIVSFLGFFSLSGLGTATTSTVARDHYGNFQRAAWQTTLAGLVGGALLSAFGAYRYLALDDELMGAMLFLCGLHGPGLWTTIHVGRWVGEGKYRTLAAFQLGLRCLEVLATISIVLFTGQTLLLVLSYFSIKTISNLLVLAIQVLDVVTKNRDQQFDNAAHKYGWKTSLLGNVLTIMAEQIHRIFFGALFGPVAFASFGIGEIIRNAGFKNVYNVYQSMSVPILAKKSPHLAADTVARVFPVFLLFIASIGCVAAIIIGPTLMFVFGDKYADSVSWAYSFIGMSVLAAPSKAILPFFKAHSLTRQTLIAFWVGSLGKLIIIPCAGLMWGQVGVIIGMYIALSLSGAVTVAQFVSWRHTHRTFE